MTKSSFFPEGFAATLNEAPKYFKPIKNETTKIRIVSSEPEGGYIRWTAEGRPKRWHMTADAPKDVTWQDDSKHKKFIAVVVWNYTLNCLQVWEITQRSIYDTLESLTSDEDFGHPNQYDLKITRRGEGLETTYQVQAVHGEFPLDGQQAMSEQKIDLTKLFIGEDPFEV